MAGSGLTVIPQPRLAGWDLESVSCSVNAAAPATAVPESAPLGVNDSQAGRPVADQEYGGNPPDAVAVRLTARPAVVGGNGHGVVMAGTPPGALMIAVSEAG